MIVETLFNIAVAIVVGAVIVRFVWDFLRDLFGPDQ